MPMMIEIDCLVSQQDWSSTNQPSMESPAFHFKLIEGSEAGWEYDSRWCPIKSTVLLLFLATVVILLLLVEMMMMVVYGSPGDHWLRFQRHHHYCVISFSLAYYWWAARRIANVLDPFVLCCCHHYMFIIFADWSARPCDSKAHQTASFSSAVDNIVAYNL